MIIGTILRLDEIQELIWCGIAYLGTEIIVPVRLCIVHFLIYSHIRAKLYTTYYSVIS